MQKNGKKVHLVVDNSNFNGYISYINKRKHTGIKKW